MTTFPNLEAISDELDYEFVKDQDLAWINAITSEIKAGKSPAQIRDWWKQEYRRDAMAARIFHAARHIERELKQGGN